MIIIGTITSGADWISSRLEAAPTLQASPVGVVGWHHEMKIWLDENGKIELQAGVVMPDHFHMVFERRETPFSEVMYSLKGYAAKKYDASVFKWGTYFYVGAASSRDHIRGFLAIKKAPAAVKAAGAFRFIGYTVNTAYSSKIRHPPKLYT